MFGSDSDLMTTAQAAAVLGLHPATLSRMVAAGQIAEFGKHPGLRGPRLFHRDEVNRLANERGSRHGPEEGSTAKAG